jgi:hypothetical protein
VFALAAARFIAVSRTAGVAPRLARRRSGHDVLVERAGTEPNRAREWQDRGPVEC